MAWRNPGTLSNCSWAALEVQRNVHTALQRCCPPGAGAGDHGPACALRHLHILNLALQVLCAAEIAVTSWLERASEQGRVPTNKAGRALAQLSLPTPQRASAGTAASHQHPSSLLA